MLRDLGSRAASENVERPAAASKRASARLTKRQNEDIRKLYRNGMRVVDIARELGTTEWTVHHRLSRMGVERRPHGLTPDELQNALRLYEGGESLRSLSQKFGCSDKTMKKALLDPIRGTTTAQ